MKPRAWNSTLPAPSKQLQRKAPLRSGSHMERSEIRRKAKIRPVNPKRKRRALAWVVTRWAVQVQPYVITDIAMRMLQPRELYRAQGFPDSYVIEYGGDRKPLTKTEQVRMVGNSVAPQSAAALVRANVPELIVRDDALRHVHLRRATAVHQERAA